MAKLFESTWRSGYEFIERYYDTNINQSVNKKITVPYEWYEEQSNGLYSSILDDSIRLDKKQGNAKQGRGHYGFLDPMYRNIRDNYWDNDGYNLTPRVFYLDIETRVSTSYKHAINPHQKLTIRNLSQESVVTVGDIRENFYNSGAASTEYHDTVTDSWVLLKNSIYMERNTGFPVPEKALEPISLMQFYDNKSKVMFILGTRDWKHKEDYDFDYEVKYIRCENEIQLIETFIKIFKSLDPLIIFAWNGSGFDFPYIHNRIKNLGMDPNLLSNHGKVQYTEGEFQGKIDFKFKADGHFYIDLMEVYKKFTFEPRPSFSLDTIAEIELGERKVAHTEYAAFDDFYSGKYIIPEEPTEQQKESAIYKCAIANDLDEVRELAHSEFCYYGAQDTMLIKKLDDKLNLTALMAMIAEKMGVQIGDSMGTVKPWSQYILNTSMKDQKVIPPRKEHPDPHVVGGYVREPNRGKHKWVISADVKSMYPLLGMVGFNMSPETFVPIHKLPDNLKDIVLQYFSDQDEENRINLDQCVWQRTTELLKEHELSLSINGAAFTNDRIGLVPEMVQDISKSRTNAKQIMLSHEKQNIIIADIIKSRELN